MTTGIRRDMLAHPPPFELDLVDAERVVGWIAGDRIGFRGFLDETEATHAAWVAHRTLARRLARTHGTRLVPVDIEPLALERSDAGENDVILASHRAIAALFRPDSEGRVGQSFGFELTVPSPMTELQLRGVAYLIYRTLRKSGVRWAIWRPDAPARAERMPEGAGVATAREREPLQRPRRRAWALARRPFRWLGDRLRLTTPMEARRSVLLDGARAGGRLRT
jgi:hypothetical protein